MKIGIGAATYIANDVHMQLARETWASFQSQKHDLTACFVITHASKPEYVEELERYGEVIILPVNRVSKAWNTAARTLLAVGCEKVIVPNLDIRMRPDAVDRLVAFGEAHPEFILITAAPWADQDLGHAPVPDHWQETPHFSCFMLDQRLFDKVGGFDENFRAAYDEDLDMHYRIRLAGETAVLYEGARFFHHGSATINNDPELRASNNDTHSWNDQYFVMKWGYKPPTANDPFTDGMYRTPFDGNIPPGWVES